MATARTAIFKRSHVTHALLIDRDLHYMFISRFWVIRTNWKWAEGSAAYTDDALDRFHSNISSMNEFNQRVRMQSIFSNRQCSRTVKNPLGFLYLTCSWCCWCYFQSFLHISSVVRTREVLRKLSL